MGYLIANLYPLLLLGVVLGVAIGWFACEPETQTPEKADD